ncbi:MAG: M23 family metallopeptidase [Stagnimonas sp.]|nr:M23 family metallopeptidase [Stagnimonas sp.]
MDVIVVSHARGKTWKLRFDVAHFHLWLPMALLVVGALSISFTMGYYANRGQSGLLPEHLMTRWNAEIEAQRQDLATAKSSSEENTRALARRMAELNAQMMRLDAAGERMVKVADLDPKEFNFNRPPAVGGPETGEIEVAMADARQDPLLQSIEKFESKLTERERQMRVLEDLLMASRMQQEVVPSGWPVVNGFISSLFGYRTDPFSGRGAFHEGMDFAGKEGSGIMAVGAGVVSFAGERSGYGNLVEINHGNGYVTRYGHNAASLVKAGETVRKGQRVALMGSSGRSTGPHVHFEVLLNGSPVNPSQYIEASR